MRVGLSEEQECYLLQVINNPTKEGVYKIELELYENKYEVQSWIVNYFKVEDSDDQ